METVWKRSVRLAAAACLVALAACSGGGGGGAAPSTTTAGGSTSGSTTPTFTITAADSPVSGGTSGNYNFNTNLPPAGTSFGLTGSDVKVTPMTFGGPGLTAAQRASDTATFQGTVTSNGVTYPVVNLNIPSLGISATNVRGDATPTTTNNGGTIQFAIDTLNYTVFGLWTYTVPGGGTTYLGQSATGFLTPDSGLPTSGSATYTGNSPTTGGVTGAYAVNNGNGTVQAGALNGSVSVTANFGPNTISGTLTNMTATPTGSSTAVPWNNVSLTGTISNPGPSKNNASGSTAALAPPSGAGPSAFTTAAQGSFAGSFYGPNAQEFGATWTLYEATNGGKSAFGSFGATTTTP